MNSQTLVTVMINNYNYEQFLSEAIESVLSQTYKNYEIIIVDDGSTDNSMKTLNETYADHEKITIISKSNEGQLSCFNEGIAIANGEIIFFLDADDTYKKNYLEEVVGSYQNNKNYDFVFCALEEFGNSHNIHRYKHQTNDIDLGISFLETLVQRSWIGMPTSGISVKKELLNKILPIPYLSDWITRADDCIVWGASLAGANKFYISKPLVNYRIHGNNLYMGRKYDDIYQFKRELTVLKLFNFFGKKLGFENIDRSDIKKLIIKEYRTKPNTSIDDIRLYVKIAKKLNIGFMDRIKIGYKLYRL